MSVVVVPVWSGRYVRGGEAVSGEVGSSGGKSVAVNVGAVERECGGGGAVSDGGWWVRDWKCRRAAGKEVLWVTVCSQISTSVR